MPLEPQHKQRLVGAVVLVALAVIFVPMVLDSERAATLSAGKLPEKPGFHFEPITIPNREPEPFVARPAIVERTQARPVALGPVEKVAESAEDAPKVESGDLPGWAVQVGSFSSMENALALRDRLRGKDFPAFVEQIAGEKGAVYRVRVGPEASRERAEVLQNRVKAAFELPALVMSHP